MYANIAVDGKVYLLNGFSLHGLYERRYHKQYQTLDDFEQAVKNATISIDYGFRKRYEFFMSRSPLDADVTDEYLQRGVKGLLERYCVETSDNHYRIKFFQTKPTIHSVVYYCFINGYTYHFSDLSGEYSIWR